MRNPPFVKGRLKNRVVPWAQAHSFRDGGGRRHRRCRYIYNDDGYILLYEGRERHDLVYEKYKYAEKDLPILLLRNI